MPLLPPSRGRTYKSKDSIRSLRVTDVVGNRGAGTARNLIQQKLEVVFSFWRVVYLEEHHIIKTIL